MMGKVTLALLVFLISLEVNSSESLFDTSFEYPSSKLYVSGKLPLGERTLVKSAVKRINNGISIEAKSVVVSSSRFFLYKLSGNSNLEDVYDFYSGLLKDKGILSFTCSKRDCGINNYWANKVFDNSELKGRDSDQYYVAGEYNIEGRSYFVSVYVVSNFLRQNIIRLEFVPLLESNNLQTGAGWYQGYLLEENYDVKQLAELLRSVKKVKSVEVVAYTDNYQRISVEKSIDIEERMKNIQSSLAAIWGDEVIVDGFVVGHRNVETEDINSDVWFRIFVY